MKKIFFILFIAFSSSVWAEKLGSGHQSSNAVVTGLKEGQTTVSSSYKGVTSEPAQVLVYLEIGGHRLPPEPDPAVNNSTLLGIDSNGNGVRDDVERWIYQTYNTYIPCKKEIVSETLPDGTVIDGVVKRTCEEKAVPYHQIVREIAMQGARAAQIIIQEPEKARETTKYMDAAQDCNFYFQTYAKYNNEPILIDHHIFDKKFDAVQFNTVMRSRAYAKYNFALSGGVYASPKNYRIECDFDIDTLLGK